MYHKDFLRNKNIFFVGLGPNFELIEDIKFLSKNGVNVYVYESRNLSDNVRQKIVNKLTKSGVIIDNIYINEKEKTVFSLPDYVVVAKGMHESHILKSFAENNVNIETIESLFLKLAPPIILIGILGLVGKGSINNFLNQILENIPKNNKIKFINLSCSEKGVLNLLKDIEKGEIVITEIDKDQIKIFSQNRLCPAIALIGSLGDGEESMIFSKEILSLLKYQIYNNYIVATDDVIDKIKSFNDFRLSAKMMRVKGGGLLFDKRRDLPLFQRENMAIAIECASILNLDQNHIAEAIEKLKSHKSCLELVRNSQDVSWYDDSYSIYPFSTSIAIQTLGQDSGIVLIIGGEDRGFDTNPLLKNIIKHVNSIVFIPGNAINKLHKKVFNANISTHYASSIKEAVKIAKNQARRGMKILFSPAFSATKPHINRDDRAKEFTKLLKNKNLK